MKTIVLRTGLRALVRSKATVTCVVFVLFLLPFLIYFLVAAANEAETMRTLYQIAALAPGLGILLSVGSLIVVWMRRRQAVLRIDDRVRIERTGVEFDVDTLAAVQVWSDRTPRSYVALLPEHVQERMPDRAAIDPYVVHIPRGANVQPIELAELLQERNPTIVIDKLGLLTLDV